MDELPEEGTPEYYEHLRSEADRLLKESEEEQVELVSHENSHEKKRKTEVRVRKTTLLETLDKNVESVGIRKPLVGTFFGCLGCGKEILERKTFRLVQYCIPCRLALGVGKKDEVDE